MPKLQLPLLNFPEKYSFRVKQLNESTQIFCSFRKQWVVLTPEEWVRQNYLQFLVLNKNFPTKSIAVERSLLLNKTKKRADIVVFKDAKPFLLVECKAQQVALNQTIFEQAIRYNLELDAHLIVLTNGYQHLYFEKVEGKKNPYKSISELRDYKDL